MSEGLRQWLTEELERRKWSHRELARQTGFSQSFVSKTLAGERNPSVDFCIKIAQTLDETPEKILRLAGILPAAPAADDSTLQELIELARNLPPEDRQELLKYARFRYQQHDHD